MEISRRTDYAVRVILDLASLPDNGRASAQEIAVRQNVPGPFLAKIISRLALSGLVTTRRGAGGGVALARPASQITLLQVIQTFEGPVRLNRCLIQPDACPQDAKCPVHEILALGQSGLVALLETTTFESLANAAREKAQAI